AARATRAAPASRHRARRPRRAGTRRQTPGTERNRRGSSVGAAIAELAIEGLGRLFQTAAFGEHLDTLLGPFQAVVTEAREADAPLEQRQRLLEWQVALLEGSDDLVEFGHRRLEIGGVGVGRTHRSSSAGGRAA